MARSTMAPQQVTGGEDRLSALPDDLLVRILHHLDTRSALATAVLARRWVRLPRRLRALDLKARDILSPDFIESFGMENLPYLCTAMVLDIRRCSMVCYTNAIERLVDADAGVEPRAVSRLQLDFFLPDDPNHLNGLIDTAIIIWGVEELVIVVKPMHSLVVVTAAAVCLRLNVASRQRIRKLKVGGFCVVERMQDYGNLTELVLQDIDRPMHAEDYENIFSWCPQLRSVHLRRCCTRGTDTHEVGISLMEIYAPSSMVTELVIDECTFYGVMFYSLPLLERLACSGNPVMLTFEDVPRIAHLNLSFAITDCDEYDDNYTMNDLMGGNPGMTDLVARFTGAERWVTTGTAGLTVFHALRRLLVADVPSTWDASWPRLILESVPSLQTFHMNIVDDTDDYDVMPQRDDIIWNPWDFEQRRLEELVLVGVEAATATTTKWASLVRYVREACIALQRVVLVKSGSVDVKGLWAGWEVVVTPPPLEGAWSNEEKLETMNEINGEDHFKQQHGQVIFK